MYCYITMGCLQPHDPYRQPSPMAGHIQTMHRTSLMLTRSLQQGVWSDYCIMNWRNEIRQSCVAISRWGSLQPPIGHNTANRSPMAGHIQAMHRTSLMPHSVLQQVCSAKGLLHYEL
jgi:hypothetical protein